MVFSKKQEYRERQQDIKGFEKLEDIITEVEQTEMTDNVEQSETLQEHKQSSRNLTPLFEANGDCIGWICIPNTAVNYPVMFTPEESQKYLRKNFEGEYSVSGVPFFDGASTPECDNLIVYGHNMKNGTMFSEVTQYRNKAYWEEHPCIEFETAGGLRIYQVFAAFPVLRAKSSTKRQFRKLKTGRFTIPESSRSSKNS